MKYGKIINYKSPVYRVCYCCGATSGELLVLPIILTETQFSFLQDYIKPISAKSKNPKLIKRLTDLAWNSARKRLEEGAWNRDRSKKTYNICSVCFDFGKEIIGIGQ